MSSVIAELVAQHQTAVEDFFAHNSATLEAVADKLAACFNAGGKLLVCGNGGSACDAMHIAGEFVGRFVHDRRALPAIALCADVGAVTAIANDYHFERIFSRQVEAYGNPGDMLIALSTSGASPNVLSAIETARAKGLYTVLLTGAKGKDRTPLAHHVLAVPSHVTARVQEVHIFILHIIAALVEKALFEI